MVGAPGWTLVEEFSAVGCGGAHPGTVAPPVILHEPALLFSCAESIGFEAFEHIYAIFTGLGPKRSLDCPAAAHMYYSYRQLHLALVLWC